MSKWYGTICLLNSNIICLIYSCIPHICENVHAFLWIKLKKIACPIHDPCLKGEYVTWYSLLIEFKYNSIVLSMYPWLLSVHVIWYNLLIKFRYNSIILSIYPWLLIVHVKCYKIKCCLRYHLRIMVESEFAGLFVFSELLFSYF